jgi:hypothetical protein
VIVLVVLPNAKDGGCGLNDIKECLPRRERGSMVINVVKVNRANSAEDSRFNITISVPREVRAVHIAHSKVREVVILNEKPYTVSVLARAI